MFVCDEFVHESIYVQETFPSAERVFYKRFYLNE